MRNFFIKKWLKLIRLIINSANNIETTIRLSIFFGIISNDLSPKKCLSCGHKVFFEEITDRIGPIVTEKQCKCKNCKKNVGYWAYGSYMP